MIKLKGLAKLREYSKNQSVEDYLLGQHRQNLRAIERSFSEPVEDSSFYMQIHSLEAASGAEVIIPFLDELKRDDGGSELDGIITLKNDATYDVTANLRDIIILGPKNVLFKVIVNDEVYASFSILQTDSTDTFNFSTSFNFPLVGFQNNKIYYSISNSGGAGTISIASGLLKMNKIIT